jgi:uncharacterized membrane protein
MKYEKHKSTFGLDANIVVILVWFGGTIISSVKAISFLAIAVPFVFYFMEKESKLVKSHALQAIGLFLASLIASIVFMLIPLLWLFFWIIPVFDFVVSVLAVMKGYAWQEYQVPLIQPVVKAIEKIIGK